MTTQTMFTCAGCGDDYTPRPNRHLITDNGIGLGEVCPMCWDSVPDGTTRFVSPEPVGAVSVCYWFAWIEPQHNGGYFRANVMGQPYADGGSETLPTLEAAKEWCEANTAPPSWARTSSPMQWVEHAIGDGGEGRVVTGTSAFVVPE